MSIYSNDNIRKIAKLTTRELPQKSKNAKITVRENNGLYSNLNRQVCSDICINILTNMNYADLIKSFRLLDIIYIFWQSCLPGRDFQHTF